MIQYEKLNQNFTNILNDNAQVIGFIERNEWLKQYTIEVDYSRYKVAYKDRERIPFLINSCIKSRGLLRDYFYKQRMGELDFQRQMKNKDRSKFKILE